jgi:hypothetical protein
VVRHFHKTFSVLVTLGLTGFAFVALAAVEPRVMGDDIFHMLATGFKDLSQSKFTAAQTEFENVIKSDFDNPFANNNMAVLMEKHGKLTDAMTYLNIGEKFAGQYLYTVDKVYLIGGLCAAVNPEKTKAAASMVAQVIAENKKKLAEKMDSKPADTSKKASK